MGGYTHDTHVDAVTFSGGMSGTNSLLIQQEISTTTSTSSLTMSGPFFGTVGNSAPGTFSVIDTATIDSSTPMWTFHGTLVVVDGSGMDGLAGICGGGTFSGSGAATIGFTGTYDLTLKFGDQCHSQQ